MQLDVAARQESRRKERLPALRKVRTATNAVTELYAELVDPDAGLSVILRPNTEVNRPEKVGVGSATDIAERRRRGGVNVPGNARAAQVQPGEHSGSVMVDEVHMAEEPVWFASSHDPEVRMCP